MNTIKFDARKVARYGYEDGHYVFELVPEIDGRDLIERVTSIEKAANQSLTGTYGGLVPRFFSFARLTDYYLGRDDPEVWDRDGKYAVLGCECGEVLCQPLYARIGVSGQTVTWSDFEPLHCDSGILSRLGPFQFDRVAYESAIKDAIKYMDQQDARPPRIIERGKFRLLRILKQRRT